jgi:methyl-accepting chemotaxis protein
MRLNVGTKIALGFGIVLLILFVMGGYSYYKASETGEHLENIQRASLRGGAAARAQESYLSAIMATRGYMTYGNETFTKQIDDKFNESLKYADEALKSARRPEIRATIEQFKVNVGKHKEGIQGKLLPAVKAYHQEKNSPTASLTKMKELENIFIGIGRDLTSLTVIIDKASGEIATEAAKTTADRMKILDDIVTAQERMMLILTIASLIMGIIVSIVLTRSITRPLAVMRGRVDEMAQGHFNKDMEKNLLARGDEFGDMAGSFDKMIRSMRELIRQVAQSSEQLAASSEQLTASSQQSAEAANNVAQSIQQVAMGSEKQVGAVNETSAIVQEISATMEEVAATAGEMATLSDKTAKAAIEGKKSIDIAVNQMGAVSNGSKQAQTAAEELKVSSAQIGEIVGLISTIAGQTNLLALNAAIEAARAGEQGRGFAVVAEEVRKLAEQSEAAAHQIKGLVDKNHGSIGNVVGAIDVAIRDITQGVELVNVAGNNFAAINSQINQVTDQVAVIAKAVNEAAIGSQRIVSSIKEVENLSRDAAAESQNVSAATEEQSASMQEIAASSQALAKLAEGLQQAMSKFHI